MRSGEARILRTKIPQAASSRRSFIRRTVPLNLQADVLHQKPMMRKVLYWGSTGLIAVLAVFSAAIYLSGNQQAVQGFARVGYPQQLRVMLGIAKLLGAIALVFPGFPRLKEWAYAGFTFAWIAAIVAHYLAGEYATAVEPLVLLVLLYVSYATRPASRRWPSRAVVA